jgi:hypothetical protein
MRPSPPEQVNKQGRLRQPPRRTQVDPALLPTLETIEVRLPAQLDAINDLAKSGDWGTVQRRWTTTETNRTQTSGLVAAFNNKPARELTQAALKMGSEQRRILILSCR